MATQLGAEPSVPYSAPSHPFTGPELRFAAPIDPRADKRRYWPTTLAAVLFALSLISTLGTGARLMHNFRAGTGPIANEIDLWPWAWLMHHPGELLQGWSFSFALLAILISHEMGHMLACRRYRIRTSLPYVMPAPTLAGTAGAVIRIRSRLPSLRALLDVGVAGPIAGYLVAIPVAIVGLVLSKPLAADPSSVVQFNAPLTIHLLDAVLRFVMPSLPPVDETCYHPVLIAAWIGLLITSLNLIPAGQLDGGHILYSVSPRLARFTRFFVPVLLLIAGILLWVGWLLWALILLLPAMRHPRLVDERPIDPRRRRLALVAAILLILTITPSPFAGASLLSLLR